MKAHVRSILILGLLLLAPHARGISQMNIADDYLRQKGMEEFRADLNEAIQKFIDRTGDLIEAAALLRGARAHRGGTGERMAILEDSTKKLEAFRKARKEFQAKLDSLKIRAAEIEKKMEGASETEKDSFARELSSLEEEMNRLQERLDKMQQKIDKERKNLEKSYAGSSKNVIRSHTDVTVGRDETIDGDLVVSDGDVRVLGTVKGNIIVSDGDVRLEDSSLVEGEVVVSGGDVTQQEGARVIGGIIRPDEGDEDVSIETGDEEKEEKGDAFTQRYPNAVSSNFPLQAPLEGTFIRYNRVEGLYLGAGQTKKLYWVTQPVVTSTGSIGYGFTSHTWRYSGGLYKPFYLDNQIVEVGGEGHSLTDSKDQWLIGREENSVMAFFAREDFMDYFTRRGFSASAGWYGRFDDGYQTRVTLAYLHDTYRSMERGTNWSLFGGDKTFRENPAINEANVNSFLVTGGISNATKVWRQLVGWDAYAGVELAGGVSKGDFDFTQIVFDARRYQPLGDYINFNVRARIGASDGTLPIQRAFELGGVSTLPGYRFKEFGGSHIALLNTELLFNSSFADNIKGWANWILRSVNLILFADFGVTNTPDVVVARDFTGGAIAASLSDGFTSLTKNRVKSDAGFAIGSSDGDFRIGLAWRLDEAHSPNLVVRFTRPF